MTATALPQDLVHRSWNGLLRAAAIVAVLTIVVLGAFALGRGTADEGASSPVPAATSTAGAQTVTPPAQDPCAHVASSDC
jgi:hypothetical protein